MDNINIILDKLVKIEKQTTINPWIIFSTQIISVLIGALTVMVNNWIQRKLLKKDEEQEKKLDYYFKCQTNYLKLCNNLKNFAMNKNEWRYWLRCYELEKVNNPEIDTQDSIEYYNNHFEASRNIKIITIQINEIIAVLYEELSKLIIIIKYEKDIEFVKKYILDIDYKDPEELKETEPEKLLIELENNNKILSDYYISEFNTLSLLINDLKSKIYE